MSPDALVASSIDGLMLGFLYGLAAMGLTLIFGVMRVINLSHGPVIALGMFVILELTTRFGINPYLALVFALAIGLAFGVVIYFVAVQRVINAPELTTLLATFSVNLMIIGLGTVIWTTSPRAVNVSLGSVSAGAVTILGTHAVAVAIAIAVTIRLYVFLYRTPAGKSDRALAENPAAAQPIGIEPKPEFSVNVL